jgi:hypothetical protein
VPVRVSFSLFAVSTALSVATTLCSVNNTLADDSCMTIPGSQTEPGTHWYYHVDRATNQQCWYSKRLQRKTSTTTGSGLSGLSGKKEFTQARLKPEAAATVLPLDAARREVLFRQFLEWHERQLVGAELETLLGHQEEEPFTR